MKTIIIDNIEYELEQHDDDKTLSEIEISKGWRLLKPWEAQRLWDLGYLRDNWFFVENTNKILKKKGYVARFYADSGRTDLGCGWDPTYRCSSLGVILCRDLNSPQTKPDRVKSDIIQFGKNYSQETDSLSRIIGSRPDDNICKCGHRKTFHYYDSWDASYYNCKAKTRKIEGKIKYWGCDCEKFNPVKEVGK